MRTIKFLSRAMPGLALAAAALACAAADYPAPQEGSWVVRDFRFHTSEVLGSLVIPGIHNSMIFRANKECPYKSRWIL